MTRLDELVSLLRNAPDEVFIQPHNVPDPDAIASSLGLQYLLKERGVKAVIVYENEMEKSNSLKMLELFGVEMRLASDVASLGEEDWTVLVDVQKGNANVTDLVTDEVAVIDHHEVNEGDSGCRFTDIRSDVGACSSIITEYFLENKIDIPRNIATALLYGIFMDTSDLTRGVAELDINMFYQLYRLSDISLITELKGNQISKADLEDYARAFSTIEVYGEVGFLYLDNCNDSLLGAASDIVVTIAGVDVVVAYSPRDAGIKFSLRSIISTVSAEKMVRYILEGRGFGGGHHSMAGGFLPGENLEDGKSLHTFIRHRTISYMERGAAVK
ncbi:MAG: DHH family phosphoesterase [Spirochaetales bacterium]|nr:DHH family phosphoesterase [Spirochaetales bacterium]